MYWYIADYSESIYLAFSVFKPSFSATVTRSALYVELLICKKSVCIQIDYNTHIFRKDFFKSHLHLLGVQNILHDIEYKTCICKLNVPKNDLNHAKKS